MINDRTFENVNCSLKFKSRVIGVRMQSLDTVFQPIPKTAANQP